MKVLVTGATGLIGTAVSARLLAEGHEVVPVSRRPATFTNRTVILDMEHATSPGAWLPHLGRCRRRDQLRRRAAGQSARGHGQGSPSGSGCPVQGMRAIRREARHSFLRHRGGPRAALRLLGQQLAGDRALMASDLDWVILRPSVVLGRPVFGASALIRGLAALPVLPSMPGTARLQVVRLEDVVETAVTSSAPQHPAGSPWSLRGPKPFPWTRSWNCIAAGLAGSRPGG
jgi:uncharacterized protein YbjT (DUF2867 family)